MGLALRTAREPGSLTQHRMCDTNVEIDSTLLDKENIMRVRGKFVNKRSRVTERCCLRRPVREKCESRSYVKIDYE
jgi:hypothetical protein